MPVCDLFTAVRENHHLPRLETASIAVCMTDGKPFRADRIQLGKVTKFSQFNRIWQGDIKYEFCITLNSDVWYQILNDDQREALADLHLTRCAVEYEPETYEENGKEKKVVDEWGRVQYTDDIKYDDEGNPKWKVLPFDLLVFAENAKRYGLWLKDVMDGLETLTVEE
jgi:hypothetical protein